MSAHAQDEQPLHLVDLDSDPDPLASLVIDEPASVLLRHLENPVLRWRTSAELMVRRAGFVIAWGPRAFDVARRGGVRAGIYRPLPSTAPQRPLEGWRVAAATRVEAERFELGGWDAADCWIVPPAGADAPPRPAGERAGLRAELGIEPSDFVWLLSGDTGRAAGLREAIWAGTIMHVMERAQRGHRLLIWGDSPTHRRARRFLDQLGLPALYASAHRGTYDVLASAADAALLLPQGPTAAWSPIVAAFAGLPAVINENPEVQEILGHQENVRTTRGRETRLVVREMLRLSEVLPPRTAPDARFAPGVVRSLWDRLMQGQLSGVSAPQK